MLMVSPGANTAARLLPAHGDKCDADRGDVGDEWQLPHPPRTIMPTVSSAATTRPALPRVRDTPFVTVQRLAAKHLMANAVPCPRLPVRGQY